MQIKFSGNTAETESAFVGIRRKGSDIEAVFPLGFRSDFGFVSMSGLSDKNKDIVNALRSDIRLLVRVLCRYKRERRNIQPYLSADSVLFESADGAFPLEAYFFLITDFIENGYYRETVPVFRTERNGHIDWKRTIRNQRPYIQGNEAVYTDFTVTGTEQTDTLLSKIHRYCVYDAFLKAGCLFTDYLPENPHIPFCREEFLSIIEEKSHVVYDDRTIMLLACMKAVIDSETGDMQNVDFSCGTDRFEDVWEQMILQSYGNVSDITEWYPKPYWSVNGRQYRASLDNCHPLRPDTVVDTANGLYILDAKYHSWCNTGDINCLPWAEEINKQITYGEYAAKRLKENGSHKPVYNAFILPGSVSDSPYDFIGYAGGDWKTEKYPYEVIRGITLDTEYIMRQYADENRADFRPLSDLIKERNRKREGISFSA